MKYNIDAFSFLQEREFEPGWSSVSEEELTQTLDDLIAEGITSLEAPEIFQVVESYLEVLGLLKKAAIVEYSPTDVLTVHADENGLLDVVLGPAVFKGDEETLVVKAGSNLFRLIANKAEAECGGLVGDIEVSVEGEEKTYLSVTLDCVIEDREVQIPFVLDTPDTLSKVAFKKAVKDGDIASYLKAVPQGGDWLSMNDLELGEYALLSIVEREPHAEYGRSWLMTLEGVGDVISKGKRFEKSLGQKAQMYQKFLAMKKPVTLLVSSKKEVTGGTQVNAGFFLREPRGDRMVSGKPKELRSAAVPEELRSAAVEPAELKPVQWRLSGGTVSEGTDLKSAEVAELSDIPF